MHHPAPAVQAKIRSKSAFSDTSAWMSKLSVQNVQLLCWTMSVPAAHLHWHLQHSKGLAREAAIAACQHHVHRVHLLQNRQAALAESCEKHELEVSH